MSDGYLSTSTEQPGVKTVGVNYLNVTRTIASWLLTLDHKRIGLMYLVGVLSTFFLGGIFALLVRTELWSPNPILTADPDTYNRWFTAHGAIMVFLVIIPGVPAALGNFVLPLMLGAKDVAFPRLNLMSFYLWLTGALFFIYTLFSGGIDTGWTFYTPYSVKSPSSVIPVLTGVFILGFSSIFTGMNFLVTIHKLRPPGMTWYKMPLFLWATYSTAVIQVLATPVLAITLLLLIMERTLGVGIFDPAHGGDPVLFQHFFWFYSHPAVYIMIVPPMGVVSELIAVHSHKRIFGYKYIAFSSVAIAIFSFIVWGHHMFTSGQSEVMNAVFSAITFSVSIPSAIKIFNWLATLYKGSIRLTTPMLYGLSFIFLFSIGGLTGLFHAVLTTSIPLHDSYFVVAHFHYVMLGSGLIGFFGGLHHWWPKMTGKMFSEFWGRIACGLIFVGFNVTFFTQFVMGSQGMPRRYYTYAQKFQIYHQISTVGSYIMAAGFVLMAFYLLQSLVGGRKAPANPWGGNSLEWHTPTPPPTENFAVTPEATDPYDYTELEYDPQIDGYTSRAHA
ncbi:MAG TPA: cytochrome c oxidase subunit I [Planctomycetes bacterium]|nr:cytochrome c oxidase subunit I [Planctomycetota bacterium]HIN80278.1 cytochrome c oxidase subunit I [Planctomycetota bacterium]